MNASRNVAVQAIPPATDGCSNRVQQRVVIGGRPFEMLAVETELGTGDRRLVVQSCDPRATCVQCHCAIPPGREGRRCVECRGKDGAA